MPDSFALTVIFLALAAAVAAFVNGHRNQVLLRCKPAEPGKANSAKTGPPQALGAGLAVKGESLNVAHTFYFSCLPDQCRGAVLGRNSTRNQQTLPASAVKKPSGSYG